MESSFLKRLEILLIDDRRDRSSFFKKILEQQEFSVIWRQHWNEVEALLANRASKGESPPNIVLVDMHFARPFHVLGENPAMEGVLIIRKFLETCEKYAMEAPPIIGFTGQEDYMVREEMIQAGVTDFITSDEFRSPPVLNRRLLQCIQEAQAMRVLKPPREEAVREIEIAIVRRALLLNNCDITQAAKALQWTVEDVRKIERGLKEKGQI